MSDREQAAADQAPNGHHEAAGDHEHGGHRDVTTATASAPARQPRTATRAAGDHATATTASDDRDGDDRGDRPGRRRPAASDPRGTARGTGADEDLDDVTGAEDPPVNAATHGRRAASGSHPLRPVPDEPSLGSPPEQADPTGTDGDVRPAVRRGGARAER